MRFALDDSRNILLDGSNDVRWVHVGTKVGDRCRNNVVIGHGRSLTKGLKAVNYSSLLRL
jgi:hypothetical protein